MASMRRFRKLARHHWLGVTAALSCAGLSTICLFVLIFPTGKSGYIVERRSHARTNNQTTLKACLISIGQQRVFIAWGNSVIDDEALNDLPEIARTTQFPSGWMYYKNFPRWGGTLTPFITKMLGLPHYRAPGVTYESSTIPLSGGWVLHWRYVDVEVAWLSPFLAPFPIAWLIRRNRRKSRKRRNHCAACGYDLRGTLGAGRSECPECGKAHVMADASREP